MADIKQDISAILIGSVVRGVQSDDALYGVTASGRLVEIYDPSDDKSAGYEYASLMPMSPLEMDGSFYFSVYLQQFDGGGLDMQLMRITADGEIEKLALLPSTGMGNFGFGNDQHPSAIVLNGNWLLQLGSTASQSSRIVEVAPDGSVETLLDLFRPGYPGVLPGMAALGSTVFTLGDQRTPNGPVELWRVQPNGTAEFVYSDGVNSVISVQTTGDRAFFIVQDRDPFDTYRAIFSVTAKGVAKEVDLGEGIKPWALDKVGDDLFIVYSDDSSDGTDRIGILEASGELTPVMTTPGFVVVDIARIGDTVFFTDTEAFVYRLSDDGRPVKVTGFSTGLADGGAETLVVSDGRLYVKGLKLIDDGFGGKEVAAAFYVIDETGPAHLLAVQRDGDDLSVMHVYGFDLDLPDPVRGTPNDDPDLGGTGRGELITGVAGNDTLLGFGGNDELRGGSGRDDLFGGLDQDILDGGNGDDRLSGGFGADTFVYIRGGDHDVIVDFRQGETLQLDGRLVGTALSGADIVARFAELTDAGALLDFGRGDSLLLEGVTSLQGLARSIDLI